MRLTKELELQQPIKLQSNRVWRTYLGGKLLDDFQGVENPKDGHFPEEWILSIVSARNSGREHISDEGLGELDTPIQNMVTLKDMITSYPIEMLGKRHVETIGDHMGVLAKIIDSSERLAVQVHPNREMAKKLFASEYGKTECWHILDGRTIDGEAPFVYLGFKPGISKEKWKELFELQDIEGMLDCLHKVHVEPGETYLLEGGIPHAIGSGCFLVEIQEPTDLTIRTERTSPSGFQIDDNMCHQGIGFEKMFDCFRYEGYTREETLRRWRIAPVVISESKDYKETELIGYQTTRYFRLTIIEVINEIELEVSNGFSGLYGLTGTTILETSEGQQIINQADQYFIPANHKKIKMRKQGSSPVKLLRFFGPEID